MWPSVSYADDESLPQTVVIKSEDLTGLRDSRNGSQLQQSSDQRRGPTANLTVESVQRGPNGDNMVERERRGSSGDSRPGWERRGSSRDSSTESGRRGDGRSMQQYRGDLDRPYRGGGEYWRRYPPVPMWQRGDY